MPLKYYREEFLRQAIQSLLCQTCPDWHLLIVVEPPDQALFENLLREELHDPRIELVIMSGRPFAGSTFAGSINTGMRRAWTEFVALVFADDLLAHETARVLTDSIQAYPEADFFYSSWQTIDEHGRHLGSMTPSREHFSLDDFKWGCPIKHLMCWRREMGLAVGGLDESLINAPDDYDFPWTMAEHGAVFKAVPECLYFIRDHCAYHRLTTHTPRSIAKRVIHKILKKHRVGFLMRHMIFAKRWRWGSLGQQCIYRNAFDRWLKERLHIDAQRNWQSPNKAK